MSISSHSRCASLAKLARGCSVKGLVRLPFAVSDANVNVWLLVHVDLRQNARVRAFSEHTYAALVALRRLFEGHTRQPGRRAPQSTTSLKLNRDPLGSPNPK